VGGNPLIYIDPLGLETTVVCRSVKDRKAQWFNAKHCFVVVWHWEENCGILIKVLDKQYSLAGNPTPFPQNSSAPTFLDDREAWNSGYPNEQYPVPPPPGKTVPEFDRSVTQEGDSYDSKYGYDAKFGPNSNTATQQIIEKAGGTLPNINGAYGQYWSPPPPTPHGFGSGPWN
jgi:hypothetical protein